MRVAWNNRRVHECNRVWSDRLVSPQDVNELAGILEKVCSKHFTGTSKEDLFAAPNIMTSFVSQAGGNERNYLPVKDMASLKGVVEAKLASTDIDKCCQILTKC